MLACSLNAIQARQLVWQRISDANEAYHRLANSQPQSRAAQRGAQGGSADDRLKANLGELLKR